MVNEHANIDNIATFLGSISLCEGMQREQLEAMARQVTVRPFAAGEQLADANESVTEFWIVNEGEIEAHLTDARGRESRLGVIREGESVGEVAIMENSPRPVRFSAATRGTLLVAPVLTFRAWLDAYPALMRNLFRLLSLRFRTVVGIAPRSLPGRRLGVIAQSPRGCVLAARLMGRLLTAGERLLVWAQSPARLRDTGQWPPAVPLESLDPNQQPLLEPPRAEIDRRVVVWTTEPSLEHDPQRLSSCEVILWLVEPGDIDLASQQFQRLLGAMPELVDKVRIVWLVDAAQPVAPLFPLWKWKHPAIKAPVETHGTGLTRLERQGLDRLLRALRGYSIGIALAGGGAKGMAHLGVLRVLEEAGLSFDAMSGTSAGAMAGIMYASGMSPVSAAENFQRDLTPSRWFRALPKWPNFYLVSQFRRLAWERMLRRYLHDWRLEQLLIPFSSVTVDLVQVRPVVRNEGDAVHAILESINLPVVSRPILRNGMVLVDGGVLNNLPADVLVEQQVDFVVGVDVSSRVRHEFGGNRPDVPTAKMKPVSSLDTLLRIFEAQAHNIGNLRNRAVDFWITPDTSRFGLAEFHRTQEIAAEGEAAAQGKVAELKQRLGDMEQRLLQLPACK